MFSRHEATCNKERNEERFYLQSKSEDKFKEHSAKGKIKG